MNRLEREKITIPCPSCKKEIEITYLDIFNHREAKCKKCNSFYKFGSSETSNLKSKIHDIERAYEKLDEAFKKMLEKAEINLKR